MAKRELQAAREIARRAGVTEHRLVRLPDLREAGEIGGGRFPNYPPTYIPMRNSIFYSFAASFGEEVRASFIVGGHNGDDGQVFRDARPEFFAGLEGALRRGSSILVQKKTRIIRPLAGLSKAEVVDLAAKRKVPLELTWSCHREGNEHCWKCEGCLARLDSFKRAGVPDPLNPPRTGKIT